MSSMLDWALHYQKQGLSIIPVTGKTPLIPWKEYQTRRASEEEIKAWYSLHSSADIGVVTGKAQGFIVLDIDGPESAVLGNSRPIPNTRCVKTKRGTQYYFKFPEHFDGKTTVVGLQPLLDVRGDGGYVKVPPSQFSDQSGRYEWINGLDTPLAECPQWLIDLFIEKNKPRQIDREEGSSWLKEKLDGIQPGNRNATFTSIAGSLRSRGYNSSDIYCLLEARANEVDFDLHELRTICESVSSYPTGRTQVNTEAQSITDFLKDEQKVEWLVPGIIAKGSIGFIAGLQESGKTWLAIDLAVEIARGDGYWLGKFQTKGAKVLFVDQERHKSETQRRFKAVLLAKNLSGLDMNQDLHIASGTTTRLNLQQSFDAFRHKLAELKPDIVIVDSFVTFHTVAENDRTEIQKVLELIKDLRNEFGCTFLFINHEGKGVLNQDPEHKRDPHSADMMGSVAIPAAAELVLTVRRKDKDSCVVYMTKSTLGPKIEPFEVSVRDVDEEKTKIEVRAS